MSPETQQYIINRLQVIEGQNARMIGLLQLIVALAIITIVAISAPKSWAFWQ